MRSVKNINFHKDLYMDLFLPKEKEFFTIIHFHGGGLIEGDKGDSHKYCEHLANNGFTVFTANYSLLPNHRFPSFIEDAGKAVRYAMDNISEYGVSKGFIISGQSAGAYLTLMLCLNESYLKAEGVDSSNIVGWISDAGQPTSHFNILKIEKGLSPLLQRIDETAPLYYVNENTKLSHLLLFAYEEDLPNRVEQNKLLVSSLKSFNKETDVEFKLLKKWHCHGSSELDDDGEYEVIKEIKKWAKRL